MVAWYGYSQWGKLLFLCVKSLDPLGHHTFTCIATWCDAITKFVMLFFVFCRQAGIVGQMEVNGLGHDARRMQPADVLVPSCVLGKSAALDLTATSPLTPISLNEVGVTRGSTAQARK